MPETVQPVRILPDINLYQQKKNVGTAMLDVVLLSNNVFQLRHIISYVDTANAYFYTSISLVVSSIVLQIIVGIFLAINCRYNVKDCDDICKADRVNNWITVLIFLITALNIIIPAFGIPEKE